jgi:LmbE family N-acetylglucosaminyl deacetylase
MTPPSLRPLARRLYRRLLQMTSVELTEVELAQPAVVFCPHPDDEVLGCGGTLARKVAAGAVVRVVFLTNGSRSHPRHLDPQSAQRIRRGEALASCRMLGIPACRVRFLGFPDGDLSAWRAELAVAAADILRCHRPSQVFLPSRHDVVADHVAACAALRAAASAAGGTTVLEYPVWFWRHWPWVGENGGPLRRRLGRKWDAVLGAARLFAEFRCTVDIRPLLDRKAAALACHASQMVRPPGCPDWPILTDVAGGEFLACLTGGREYFRRYTVSGSPSPQPWISSGVSP